MRLINTSTLVQEEFFGNHSTPEYAILSHCWGSPKDEVSYRQFQDETYQQDLYGWQKIVQCCRLAKAEGLQWAWVDTCCIDKSSSAELTEAINSMFKWYKKSKICYVFLPDVSTELQSASNLTQPLSPTELTSFRDSKWFTRGWTLQELLAPSHVTFFDKRFQKIGSKSTLASQISLVTGIEKSYLTFHNDLKTASVAIRMSWASRRETSRAEDIAYSLLGIFDVNMPLLYGEGNAAFVRLQMAIMQSSQDSTIFAWQGEDEMGEPTGVLARSPHAFLNSGDIVEDENHLHPAEGTFETTSRGILYWLKPLTPIGSQPFSITLRCKVARSNQHVVLRTRRYGRTWYRIGLQKRQLTILDRLKDSIFAIVVPAHIIHMAATSPSNASSTASVVTNQPSISPFTVWSTGLGVALSSAALFTWLPNGAVPQPVAICSMFFALEIVPLTARAMLSLAWLTVGSVVWVWRVF